MTRMTKKRTLQKAGFVHVAGWVREEIAPQIQAQIDADKKNAEKAAANDRS